MIDLAEARQAVLGEVRPLVPRHQALATSSGCVLAEDVSASAPVPAFANSAMDGYAVRAADTGSAPCALSVVATVLAGDQPAVVVGPGQAARIMTGAMLPAGADAVCMVEHTRPGDAGAVIVEERVPPGQHVRHPGDDVAAGQIVFSAGTTLTAAHIGVLASLGCDPVLVHPRPRVAVCSTGNELATGASLPLGKIRDANRPGLLATLAADGFVPVDLGVLPDDEATVDAALRAAVGDHDAVVTSGGVSVGDRDVVRMVLQAMPDASVRWMQVAIKPAKPLAFGRVGDGATAVFGLPGNPVSALVSYELFVRPALRALAGHRRLDRTITRAVAAAPLCRRQDGKLHFVRVHAFTAADGTIEVTPVRGQGSHQLRAMADANALAIVPDCPGVAAGAPVAVLLLEPASVPAADGSPLGAAPGFDLVPPWALEPAR